MNNGKFRGPELRIPSLFQRTTDWRSEIQACFRKKTEYYTFIHRSTQQDTCYNKVKKRFSG